MTVDRQRRALVTAALGFLGIERRADVATPTIALHRDVNSRRGGSVLRVGPTRTFSTPSAAAAAAADGDTIEIEAGVYEDDTAIWTQNHLTLRGVEGRPHLRASRPSRNLKGIWVIQGRNTTIENIEFSGAHVPHKNGAGIRGEGVGLVVRRCFFHDNENGILAGGGPDSDIVVEHSEFAANGHGDGYSHNIYIVSANGFMLRGSYVHHARVGHNVKSRARRNQLLYNRIMDEAEGTSSYAIDLPNGGLAYVIGNLIQQGPRTENSRIIAYGAEGLAHPRAELYVVNNTIVNDFSRSSTFVRAWGAVKRLRMINNLFVGAGKLSEGVSSELIQNLRTDDPRFVDRASFDYRLTSGSAAIDAGVDPGAVDGVQLTPTAEYVHPLNERRRGRIGPLDIGAHEYGLP